MKLTSKITLPIVSMLIIALGILSWQVHSNASRIIQDLAEKELKATAGQYGNEVKSFFETPINSGQAFADALAYTINENRTPDRDMLINMLKGLGEGNPDFFATGAAWEPDAYDLSDQAFKGQLGSDETGRFLPYMAKGEELTPFVDLESEYYALPKKRNHSTITNPFTYPVGGKTVLLTTVASVVNPGGKFRGAIYVDISMEKILALVDSIKLYDTGWGAVISQDGTIIAHKDKNLLLTDLTQTNQVGDKEGLKKAMAQGKEFMEIHNAGNGDSFFYYFPIVFPSTAQTWYFMVSVPQSEILAPIAVIRNITMGISFVILILTIATTLIIVRRNVKPLGLIAEEAAKVASGNYNVSIDHSKWSGETKELCVAIETMIFSLVENINKAQQMSEEASLKAEEAEEAGKKAQEALCIAERAKQEGMLAAAAHLEDVVAIVSSASEELSAQITQSETGAAAQASSVAETATAMEEMNSTVLEVARSASMAAEATMQSKLKAVEGAQIVDQAVNGIRDVQNVAVALKSDMENLASQAEAISDIMSVISDIADQTNLLALNAAIEAARAGEAGRGFAVVADEVRKLAEKTMTSTSDVGSAISNIQKSVAVSMQQMDKVSQLVDAATERSHLSGEALNEIVGIVENAADQVQSIATASEEQSATSEEINRSVAEVNRVAEQTSAAMREASHAVAELAKQTQELSSLIEEMKRG